jgi:predicted ATPase/DNA-binding SARP family transcriptional activator
VRFGVLGPLAVWTTGGAVVPVPEAKVRALLAELLVHDGRPVSTDELIEDLWSGHPPGKPVGTLQAKVSHLRRVLEDAEPGGRQLVVSVPSAYQLDTSTAVVDAGQFAALAERARATDDLRDRVALLTEALGLWGPAFADVGGESFARPAVTRLEEERLVVLEERIEARLGLGEHHDVAGELSELVALHPLRERLRGAHMRALYRAGRQSEALASYGELRDQLVEELGVDPSPELAELHLAILRHDPQLAPPRMGPVPGNLPVALTDLIGRATGIAEVTKLLTAHRLVTLTGPGGVGKTRLAVEAAGRMGATYADGAWLVELGPVGPHRAAADVGSLVATVNATLDIREAPASGAGPAAAVDGLARALRAKNSLLVLDNCEHVVEAAAELARRLLTAAPNLRILATSREPLGLAGEALWIVPPLEAPGPDLDPEPGSLQAFSAVQLFVARAAAAAPGFALSPTNAAAVAAICRRLDGIPLALELAATRVRGLGVHELATRVDDRFRLLVANQHGGPRRQQTLRAVIDWSWDLLGPTEQAVLRRLAVGADACALAGAEQICSGDGVEATDVAPVLARLVDRSMVVMVDTGGAPRYRLLESVAAYGLDRLVAAGEANEVRRRHRRYHTELTEQAAAQLRGPDQREWMERLDPEAADLRRSLETAVEDDDSGLALRLVNAAAWYWFLRGRLVDGRRALETALAAARGRGAPARAQAHAWLTGFSLLAGHVVGSVDRAREAATLCDAIDQPAEQARARWFLGFATSDWGDPSTSDELVTRALTASRSVGDHWGIAAALSTRAKLAYLRGDLTAVRDNGEQSFTLFRDLGDGWGQLQATEWLGAEAMAIGDYDRATQLYQDGRRMAEALALWPQAADQMSWLGRVEALVGDPTHARSLHRRAMQLATDHGYQPGADFAELGLADTARRQGDLATAEHHLTRVLDRIHANDLDPGMTDALVLAQLGFVAEQTGDAQTARARHLGSLTIARKLGDPRAIARALEGLAGAHTLTGNPERAAELLGAAEAARNAAGAPLPPALRTDADRITHRARAALGPARFAAAHDDGTNLDPRDPATT